MNIIVTGASQGIGRAVVRKLAFSGSFQIIAVARNGEKLRQLAEECKGITCSSVVIPFQADLSDASQIEQIRIFVSQNIRSIDVLVNNAGLLINKPFGQFSTKDFEDTFNVNVKAIVDLSQALLNHFSRPAHIVNISSMGGVQGSKKFPGLALYSAAKGAVIALTEAMAEELKGLDIKVNCLALGAVQTEMLSRAFPNYRAPLHPEEMAQFIADFALNGHRYFNGKTLQVSVSTP